MDTTNTSTAPLWQRLYTAIVNGLLTPTAIATSIALGMVSALGLRNIFTAREHIHSLTIAGFATTFAASMAGFALYVAIRETIEIAAKEVPVAERLRQKAQTGLHRAPRTMDHVYRQTRSLRGFAADPERPLVPDGPRLTPGPIGPVRGQPRLLYANQHTGLDEQAMQRNMW